MEQINKLFKITIAVSVILLAGCRAKSEGIAEMPVLPTDTRVPATETPLSPTNTPVPPTETPITPTNTPPPPTDTSAPVTATPALPTEEFTRTSPYGDGYVAHIPISEAQDLSSEELVNLLVTQYLEHYRSETSLAEWRLLHYEVEDVTIVYEAEDKSPFIKASVVYWVIPDSPWFRDVSILTHDPWGLPSWCYDGGFAIHGNVPGSSYYWLRSISLAVLYGL